ncbi:hypothetical protein KCU81_g9039, partial [Aureobasidium melanogenum]|uniref:Transcription activator GCR1-like domain-containing protein n=1 Tax=Aureobasidium melanogenum (strain CBS 110374) TaxID=1043003 RepID=A0A074VBU3_AURM1
MPPILLMKRTLDDLEDLDAFDDFGASEDEKELVEPHPKRLRDKSSIAREEKPQENHAQTEEKDVADRLVELMMPRMEAQMQQLVNGAAMRMLDVLSQKLARLESRIDEMHNEWKRSIGTSLTDLKRQDARDQEPATQQYQFGNRHQSAVQQYYGRTQAPPITALKQDTNTSSRPDDPLQTFFQEAAQAADTPTIVGPTSNRRVPFMARRHRQMATPGFGPNAQTTPNGTADINPEDAPQYRLQRGVESVMQLWHEFFVGSAEKPAINELDHKYGSAWRWKDNKEGVYYSMRRVVIDEIQARVEARCPNSTGATGDIWIAVCEEMDAERTNMQFTLNQYIFELKRRDKPVPVPGTKKWDPNNPNPPPPPVLSRSTPSVQKLWTEWFSGKLNYNGYATFPSIVQLNHKFGNTWRQFTTPEYNIYLKRRCIIDIALRRIVEVGGDKTETTKKVLKMMDAERVAHNLSLVQYHAWAREKYGYHASSRTHFPKFVADLGEAPEEAIELEARTRSQQDEEDGVVREHSTDIDTAILGHERQSKSRNGQGQDSPVPPSPASLG